MALFEVGSRHWLGLGRLLTRGHLAAAARGDRWRQRAAASACGGGSRSDTLLWRLMRRRLAIADLDGGLWRCRIAVDCDGGTISIRWTFLNQQRLPRGGVAVRPLYQPPVLPKPHPAPRREGAVRPRPRPAGDGTAQRSYARVHRRVEEDGQGVRQDRDVAR